MFPSICVRRWLSLGAQSGATLSPFSDQGAPKAHQRRLRTLTDVTKFGFQTQGQIESVSGGGPGRSLGWVLRGSSGVFFLDFFSQIGLTLETKGIRKATQDTFAATENPAGHVSLWYVR